MTATDGADEIILILAPTGRDAPALAEVLGRSGLQTLICDGLAALVAALQAGSGAGAVVAAEEGLRKAELRHLVAWIDRQPAWSDMPFIVLMANDSESGWLRWRQATMIKLRNTRALQRPMDALSIVSASLAALRSRRRQYRVRAADAAQAAAAATLEKMVILRTRELEATNVALHNQMFERQKAEGALRQAQKMEAVGQLTGGLAHDFNNMLAGISGSLELLKVRIDESRFDELERYVSMASAATGRAATLTHRLLAFSRRQTLAPRPTDANALVAGLGELVQRTVGPAIGVRTVLPDGLWATLCDPHQLESALLNLAINARDAMPDGGTLTLETAHAAIGDAAVPDCADVEPGDYVVVRVADTGTGMTSEVVTRAFEPFFTTKPTGEGTGLGLSMVYGFAKQSGGHVRIDSTVGCGTTISIFLPRHMGLAVADNTDTGIQPMESNGQGEQVLVVDDEPTVRMLVCEVLSDLGYAALEAEDGPEGLRILESGDRVDLLITDVGLPNGMNGRQLADAAIAMRPDLRVLFITGYADEIATRRGQFDARMDILTKPFSLHTLAGKINKMISSSKQMRMRAG